jgi:hypothetical protein
MILSISSQSSSSSNFGEYIFAKGKTGISPECSAAIFGVK